MNLFIETLSTNPQLFFMQLFVVVFSICCHEYSHARVALWQGDATAAEHGHLTLNPLKQMGVYSLVILAFVGIAWGKVPVNPNRMKHKYSDALVSFAGPAMNLFLFALCAVFYAFFYFSGNMLDDDPVLILFALGGIYNMVLFLFNMLPVPMLDGWGIFKYFFPKLGEGKSEFFNGFTVFLCLVAIMGIHYLLMGSKIAFGLFVHLLLQVIA